MPSSGKNILITGASRGIGFSIAKSITRNANIGTLYLLAKNKVTLDKAMKRLPGNQKIIDIAADLTIQTEVTKVVKEISSQTNSLDVLINNAGKYLGKSFIKTSSEELNMMINLNFKASYLLIRQLLPLLLNGKSPLIINISSCAATAQIYGEAAYSASKAALTAFSNVLRKEINELGIRVTAIQPWGVDTYSTPQPDILLNPDQIGELVMFIINRPPDTQLDLVELSHIKQWRGTKPSWIE